MILLRRAVTALLLLLLTTTSVHADDVPTSGREGFALVLGGGGAKGLAHIGVVQALEELGVAPSMIVGTSMGAIVGSLVASGLDVPTIEAGINGRNWVRTLLDRSGAPDPVQGGWSGLPPAQLRFRLDSWPPRLPPGASQGHAVEAFVGTRTAAALYRADNDFDALPIPFRAVVTDLVTGEKVVFDHGPMARLVRASGSLPLIFVPVEIDGHLYVDGGFVDNLPLGVAREEGFERSVVVDVSNAFLPVEEEPRDLFSLVARSTQLVQMAENRIDPGPGDVVIRPDLRRYSFLSFYSASDIIEVGYRAAMEKRDEILAVAAASGPAARRVVPSAPEDAPVPIAAVEVSGARRLSAWSIRKRLGVAAGDTLSLGRLHARAEELSRQSLFESIWVESRPTPDGAHVTVHVDESDEPELEIAANYRDEIGPGALVRLRLDNRFGAGGSRALTWRIDPENAVLRLDTAVPVRGSRRTEFRLSGGWFNERIDVQRGGGDTWHFRRGVVVAEFVRAWNLGQPALHVGIEGADGRRSLTSGDPAGDGRLGWRAVRIGLETWNAGGLNVWPREGMSLWFRHGIDAFGGTSPTWAFEGGWLENLVSRPRWGIRIAAGGAWSSPDLPTDLQARAGGPDGWVGQDPDAIIAPRMLWSRLGLEWRFAREVRVELAGAVGWAGQSQLDEQPARPGAQIRLVWDSALGPIQLGWAGGRASQPRLVLDVGASF